MRSFTFSDAESNEFRNIELKGKSFTVTSGRTGTPGRTQTRDFPDEAKARKEYEKLIQETLAKGYTETTAAAAVGAVASPMRQALEKALLERPDDLAAHAAYADLLVEEGDPRGEFIHVQLALEDANKPPAERKKLQQQEKELLEKYGRQWLGGLAASLLDRDLAGLSEYESDNQEIEYGFARGWLDSLRVKFLTVQVARALVRAPEARLLRRLAVEQPAYQEPAGSGGANQYAGSYEPGDDLAGMGQGWSAGLYLLLRFPSLGNVRVFQLGEQVAENDYYPSCHTGGSRATELIRKMPRVEELYLLAHRVDTETLFGLETLNHLRVLQVYHVHDYPLERLANNPALGNLTRLSFHPHGLEEGGEPYINRPGLQALLESPHLTKLTHLHLHCTDVGDGGCEDVVRSGILKRLNVLDLRHGCITDEGARTLAACPDLKNLELLDLDRNALTKEGSQALQAVGIRVRADNQQTADEVADRMYLLEADAE